MKKVSVSLFVVMFLLVSLSYGLGLGVMLGEPTGISAKMWKSDKIAYDAGLAWAFTNNSYLHLHADYLIHKNDLIKIDKFTIPFYYGLGARIGFGDEFRLGARIPVGVEYFFGDKKFDAFCEIVPVLDLLPGTGFGVGGAIGLRYNF